MAKPCQHACIVTIMFIVGPLAVAGAGALESAKMLPADTAVMLSADSVEGLKAAIKKTSFYGLYKDPAMQEVVGPAEKKIREKIDGAVKDLWKKIKIETPPQTIPWPEGRVIAAIFVSAKEVSIEGLEDAKTGGDSDKPDTNRSRKGQTELIPDLQIVAMADMGKNTEQAKTLAQQLSQSAGASGSTKKRQQIRGVEFQIFADDKDKTDGNDVFCFGFKDNWLIVGSSVHRIEQVVRHMDRDADNSLATQRSFQTAARTVGEGDLFFFLNADPIRQLVKAVENDSVQVNRMIQALGLDNVTGLAAAWQIAANKQENASVKVLLGVAGQKKGIPALLCPASAQINPKDRLLGRDVVLCAVSNHDLAKVYDQIAKMVMDASAVDINFFVQTAMAGTGGADQPPLNLRNDVLAHASTPLIFSWRMDKPYTDAQNSRTLVGVAVRDAEKLDMALARIHQAYVAKSKPDLRRTMLEHTLYLLPPVPMVSPFLAQMGQATPEPMQFAFAVAAGHLALGEVGVVEQVIRDSQKEPSETLGSDLMFRHAKRFLPSEAGIYWYQNGQRYWDILWTVLKTQARQAGTQSPADSKRSKDLMPEHGDDEIPVSIKELRQAMDLTKLPEYDTVKRYFGASAGYLKEHPEGIILEQMDLRPPE